MLTSKWSEEYKESIFTELMPEFIHKWELEVGLKQRERPKIVHITKYETAARALIADPRAIRGLATGFPKLDKHLGGLDKGELIIISGSTGTGKTMLAINLLLSAYRQAANDLFTTLVFSMEMTNVQVTARVHQIINDTPFKDETNALPIYFYDSNREPDIALMRQAFEQCQKEHGLDVVLIDHLHYFTRSTENQANEIGALVRSIKLLAKEFDVPVILLAHLRKKPSGVNQNKTPELDDLRDSSFIAQDADIVVLLQRDIMDETKNQYLKVFVAKNRNKGILGVEWMTIRPDSFRLEEVDPNDALSVAISQAPEEDWRQQ